MRQPVAENRKLVSKLDTPTVGEVPTFYTSSSAKKNAEEDLSEDEHINKIAPENERGGNFKHIEASDSDTDVTVDHGSRTFDSKNDDNHVKDEL